MRIGHLCLVVTGALGLWLASPAGAAPDLHDPDMERGVAVRDLDATSNSVRARLSNQTDGTLSNIRILVTHAFLWDREQNPGDDSPGRSDVFVIEGPIPPHGTIAVEEALVPPLPPRADGRFQTSVQVLGFTKVGP
jgi:hypothetical protein